MKRLCPPPSPWRSLRVGDRVRFQSEDMPVEIEDTIAQRQNSRLVTTGGREILPDDYVFRLAARIRGLVQDIHETRRRLARPAN